jgi:Outer membrane efflux protein
MNLTGLGFVALRRWAFIALAANANWTFAQSPLTLEQVLQMGLDADSSLGLKQATYDALYSQGSLHAAQSAFDWTLLSNAGYRRLPVAVASGDFLTTGVEYKDIQTSYTGVEKLLESGIRVRPGMQVSSGANTAQLAQGAMLTQPTLELQVPLGSAWGAPPERLRLDAARANFDAAGANGVRQQQLHLARLFKLSWALLAAQKKQAAAAKFNQVAEEFAQRAQNLGQAGTLAGRTIDRFVSRSNQARLLLEQTQLALNSAQLDLALLLGIDVRRVGELSAAFPSPSLEVKEAVIQRLLTTALERRTDLQGEIARIEAARHQSQAIVREADSTLSLQLARDRLMLNWMKPLGDNRNLGAREQAEALTRLAELRKDELVRRIEMEVRTSAKRIQEIAPAVIRMRGLVERLHAHLDRARLSVQSGFDPAEAVLDQAEGWSGAAQQLIDLELSHAFALVDLHLAAPTAVEKVLVPAKLVSLYTKIPAIQ